MRVLRILILAVIPLFLFSYCEDNSAQNPKIDKSIWPMGVGYYWKYHWFIQYKGQNYKELGISKCGITEKMKIGKEYWYVMTDLFFPDTLEILHVDDKGVWSDVYTGKKENTTYKYLAYKYPTYAGELNIYGDDTIVTVATSVPISTVYGEIDQCVKYASIDNKILIFFRYGLGPVKIMWVDGYYDGSPLWKVKELYEYYVGL